MNIESWLHRMLNIWDVIQGSRLDSSYLLKSETFPEGWLKSLGVIYLTPFTAISLGVNSLNLSGGDNHLFLWCNNTLV